MGFIGLPWASTAHAILDKCLGTEGRHGGGGKNEDGERRKVIERNKGGRNVLIYLRIAMLTQS